MIETNTINSNYKKITLLLEKDVYLSLQEKIGKGKIGKFISKTIRPYLVSDEDLKKAYIKMSKDKEREKEANIWSENLIGDLS